MKRKEVLYLFRNQAELTTLSLRVQGNPQVQSFMLNWNCFPFGKAVMAHYLIVQEGLFI